jgi:hypothetical protein
MRGGFARIESIAIGVGAGQYTGEQTTIAIGKNAGQTQGISALAIGAGAGQFLQGRDSVAIGTGAGASQDTYCVAIGSLAGNSDQGGNAVAIGRKAGIWNQGSRSTAVGHYSGCTNQGDDAVAIGHNAGTWNQGGSSVAVGSAAGLTGQGTNAIAIGQQAGSWNQSANAIAIGDEAGFTGQGANAIAIGDKAGSTSQNMNSIILNASGSDVDASVPGFHVNPIREFDGVGVNIPGYLFYDAASSEIRYNSATKNFIIDHPTDKDRYLVHACLEGPEAGVYYRGQSEIEENKEFVEIQLPNYVSSLSNGFTVQLTPIYDENCVISVPLRSTYPRDNRFRVYGQGKFFWVVHGKRLDVDAEPLKKSTTVYGIGPYKWL